MARSASITTTTTPIRMSNAADSVNRFNSRVKLPVIIHTRERRTIPFAEGARASEIGGVFHCFSGDAWRRMRWIGILPVVSGILTFQNATMLRDIAKTVPADRLLIKEPIVLLPHPDSHQGNDPADTSPKHWITSNGDTLTTDDISRLTSDNPTPVQNSWLLDGLRWDLGGFGIPPFSLTVSRPQPRPDQFFECGPGGRVGHSYSFARTQARR